MSRIIANNIRHNDATADNLSFDSSARVGIGTSSPTRPLTVAAGSGETVNILGVFDTRSANPATVGNSVIAFSDPTSTAGQFATRLGSVGDSLAFYTNGSNERLRITGDGTLQLRNSPGIDFSQIQTNNAGMTSETLDSYEEGTWTPVLSEEGGSPTIGYGFRNGRYVKVGSSVMIYATIRVNSLSGSGSNPLQISGFPFAISSSSTTLVTSLDVGLIAGSWSSNFPGRIYWREGQTSAYVGISNSTAIVVGTNLTSTSEIGFSGWYTTGLT